MLKKWSKEMNFKTEIRRTFSLSNNRYDNEFACFRADTKEDNRFLVSLYNNRVSMYGEKLNMSIDNFSSLIKGLKGVLKSNDSNIFEFTREGNETFFINRSLCSNSSFSMRINVLSMLITTEELKEIIKGLKQLKK